MTTFIKSLIANCTSPAFLCDPEFRSWLTEMQATLSGEDLEDAITIHAEMNARCARPYENMTIHHQGYLPMGEVDESFATWLEKKGYFDIDIPLAPLEEGGWWVWFDSKAPGSFGCLIDSFNEIHDKFAEFGGTYERWFISKR
ncbi:hypothetical protein C6Q02_01085 [Burkholderia multivorans]|uniref:hypothetical protein n=1 Tax=Burkholderia multivorans TaxID=87883 RepID=UPI000CFF68DE|nr:hypothetical protein [Burkholderia multivorans]PRE93278.1 hypothetical protein C6Q02_01085 [Burkholderia multivorans]